MTIAVDFDGTIVENKYPNIGAERPFAIQTLRMLMHDQHRLILWSCREHELLNDAIQWCRDRGVEFWAINKDYPEEKFEFNEYYSRKIKVDVFIDDRNVGGIPQWGVIYQIISSGKSFEQIMKERLNIISTQPQKRKHWWNKKNNDNNALY